MRTYAVVTELCPKGLTTVSSFANVYVHGPEEHLRRTTTFQQRANFRRKTRRSGRSEMGKSRGEGRKRCGARFGPKPGGGGTSSVVRRGYVFVSSPFSERWKQPMAEVTPLPKGIGQPATRAFALAGFTSLESIAGASRSHLIALHGVGPKAIRVLQEALESRGLPSLTE